MGVPRESRRRFLAALVACPAAATIGLAGRASLAGQEADPPRSDDLARRRFEMMRDRITSVRVESEASSFPRAFEREPIFRYSDPTMGWVSAAVWKFGAEGRPKAIVATELRRSIRGRPGISYEFSSLTTTPFAAHSDDLDWSPSGSQFDFRPVPGAKAPEASPAARLRQIREIARRFSATEDVDRKPSELRLLSTPIDRYVPSKVDRADGAIFLMTIGTNPELILLVESDGKAWSFAAGRLTGAPGLILSLDGAPAWEAPAAGKIRDASYAPYALPADVPGLAANGNDL